MHMIIYDIYCNGMVERVLKDFYINLPPNVKHHLEHLKFFLKHMCIFHLFHSPVQCLISNLSPIYCFTMIVYKEYIHLLTSIPWHLDLFRLLNKIIMHG